VRNKKKQAHEEAEIRRGGGGKTLGQTEKAAGGVTVKIRAAKNRRKNFTRMIVRRQGLRVIINTGTRSLEAKSGVGGDPAEKLLISIKNATAVDKCQKKVASAASPCSKRS